MKEKFNLEKSSKKEFKNGLFQNAQTNWKPQNKKKMIYHTTRNIPRFLDVKTGLPVQVTLGSPRRNCAGLGICKIERMEIIATAPIEAKCGKVAGLLSVKGSRIVLYILKYSISECTLRKHFSNGILQLEDSYSIPSKIAEMLGIEETQTAIRAGLYKVHDFGMHLCVEMAVSG
ncbi:MAG: hypothetical protein R2795_13675 [Saprospiraceae bacterium]